jgi:hypothetical protein
MGPADPRRGRRRGIGAVAVLAAAGVAAGSAPALASAVGAAPTQPAGRAVSWTARPSIDTSTTQYVLWSSWGLEASGTALDQFSRVGGKWRGEPPGLRVPVSSSPSAAVVPATGEVYVVWRGTGNGLNEATDINRAWTQRSLGLEMGGRGSAPSVATNATGHAFVTWATAAGEIMTASNSGGTWTVSDTGVNQGPDVSAPRIGVDPATDERVIVWRGENGDVFQAIDSGAGWSSGDLGIPTGTLTATPAIALTSTGERDVVWRNGDNRLEEASRLPGHTWQEVVPGVTIGLSASDPAIAVNASRAQYVVWRGATGQLYEASNVTGDWVPSTPGVDIGTSSSAPTVGVFTPHGARTLGQRIVATSEGQMGYTDPRRANDIFCNKYTAADGEGYACNVAGTRWEEWCADFAKWVWAKSGAEVDANLTPSAASFRLWAIANHRWHSFKSGYLPRPGDAVVYGLDSAGTWAAHVAIVVGSSDGLADVVNGDFNVSVSQVIPREIDEDTAGFNDIGGYATPMPAGSRHARVVERHLALGIATFTSPTIR